MAKAILEDQALDFTGEHSGKGWTMKNPQKEGNMTIRESLDKWAPEQRTYEVKGELRRLTPFMKKFLEADETTQRDIRNGAQIYPRSALDAHVLTEFNEE